MNDDATVLYPLSFTPVYKDYLWGGDRIPKRYRREAPPGPCAESWEVSARPEGMSVVADGPLQGRTLEDLVRTFGRRLLGDSAPEGRFPLLVKLIDARERLSVQVHPSDASAREHGGEAKTEAWHILEAAPGAGVFAGLRPDVTPEAFAQAVREGGGADLLRRIDVQAGDTVFIPGGLVHAIDAGCLLLEVQQNSDTTWRLYDWDRRGPDGKPRELHIEQGLAVLDPAPAVDPLCAPVPLPPQGASTRARLVACDHFALERVETRARWTPAARKEAFEIWFLADGAGAVEWTEGRRPVAAGTSLLIPAETHGLCFVPADREAVLLRIALP